MLGYDATSVSAVEQVLYIMTVYTFMQLILNKSTAFNSSLLYNLALRYDEPEISGYFIANFCNPIFGFDRLQTR